MFVFCLSWRVYIDLGQASFKRNIVLFVWLQVHQVHNQSIVKIPGLELQAYLPRCF